MDKTREFELHVEPLLREVFDSCLAHGIPFISLNCIRNGEESGEISLRSTNASVTSDNSPEIFSLIMMLLHEPEFLNATIGLAGAFIAAKVESEAKAIH